MSGACHVVTNVVTRCVQSQSQSQSQSPLQEVTGSGLANHRPAQLQTAHETAAESADDMDSTAELTTTIPEETP